MLTGSCTAVFVTKNIQPEIISSQFFSTQVEYYFNKPGGGGWGGGVGWGYLFDACRCHFTINYASFSRRSGGDLLTPYALCPSYRVHARTEQSLFRQHELPRPGGADGWRTTDHVF